MTELKDLEVRTSSYSLKMDVYNFGNLLFDYFSLMCLDSQQDNRFCTNELHSIYQFILANDIFSITNLYVCAPVVLNKLFQMLYSLSFCTFPKHAIYTWTASTHCSCTILCAILLNYFYRPNRPPSFQMISIFFDLRQV